jgi:hypothetical protein
VVDVATGLRVELVLEVMAFLVPLKKIYPVKCLSASWTIAGKHGFGVVVKLMSPSMLGSGEDLLQKSTLLLVTCAFYSPFHSHRKSRRGRACPSSLC